MQYEAVLYLMGGIIFVLCIVFIYIVHSGRVERTELAKMLAAKDYNEYKAYDDTLNKPPPNNHKNMMLAQQKKILSNKVKR